MPARSGDDDEESVPTKRAVPRPAVATTPQRSEQPESPVRVSKATLKTDPTLMQAYQAFNKGEYELARSAWNKVLQTDPLNADALHGLAAVAGKQQKPEEAAEYYRRALDSNPKDALALAAFASMRGGTDAVQTESRLKTLLAEQPDSPHLNFALGNLYSGSSRWAEAQQAFFRAHVADAGNPDYMFNLAVSLDQLRQYRQAAEYYNRALAAAEHQPAGFDTTQVASRLKILQSGLLH